MLIHWRTQLEFYWHLCGLFLCPHLTSFTRFPVGTREHFQPVRADIMWFHCFMVESLLVNEGSIWLKYIAEATVLFICQSYFWNVTRLLWVARQILVVSKNHYNPPRCDCRLWDWCQKAVKRITCSNVCWEVRCWDVGESDLMKQGWQMRPTDTTSAFGSSEMCVFVSDQMVDTVRHLVALHHPLSLFWWFCFCFF